MALKNIVAIWYANFLFTLDNFTFAIFWFEWFACNSHVCVFPEYKVR
jgi:hypothetical protein